MIHFDNTSNLDELTKDKEWALVYFSATWCGPCKTMSPTVESIAADYDTVATTIKIDVDEQPQLAQQFNLRSIPTLLLLNRGKLIDRSVGAQSPQQVSTWFDSHLHA